MVKFFIPSICPSFRCLDDIKNSINNSTMTKSILYRSINPLLSIHPVYIGCHSIPEYQRVIFTRLRLSSHYLRIETGRWPIPSVPREERLCPCNTGIQDESHMIECCNFTNHIRSQYRNINFSLKNILNDINESLACKILYELYSVYNF